MTTLTPSVLVARADRFQQRHGVVGFPYAVARKFLDDGGAREAALITYYGFLSLFPLLLLAVAVVSGVLAQRPGLREELVAAMVPPALQPTVDSAISALPSSATSADRSARYGPGSMSGVNTAWS